VDPFVRYLFLALVILIAVRFAVGRLGLRSAFANPPLVEAALCLHPHVSHRILDLSAPEVLRIWNSGWTRY